MKRVLLMLSVTLFSRMLAAYGLDVSALEGERWYGLYLNGHKSGYSMTSLTAAKDGSATVVEEARFQVTMGGQRQNIHSLTKRIYGKDGALARVDAQVDDASGRSTFEGVVEGDAMRFTSTVAGQPSTEQLPRPAESLKDAMRQLRLIGEHAKVGDNVPYSTFEPTYKKELHGTSTITKIEERNLEGTLAKVFEITGTLTELGVDTVSLVTDKGLVLQDTIGGLMIMRLEPKEVAQDVAYSNDVLVSNAALLDAPIEDPTGLEELALAVKGPLTERHLFNDERQTLRPKDGAFEYIGRRLHLDGFAAATLPVKDAPEDVAPWLKPSMFVQSDNPKLVAKAKEILAGATDTFKASSMLCTWVHEHVRSTFSARLSNALEVLDNPEGDCTEHSVFFVGLARAAGIPAREVAGLVYTQAPKPGFYFHQWAQVWIGKWIDVDPTFDQPLVDVTHIKLSEGDLFQQTQLVPIIGQTHVAVVEKK